jgi:hypothetical protein
MTRAITAQAAAARAAVSIACLALVAPAAGAADPPLRTQKVEEAGADFAVQGEYVGSLRGDGDAEMFGVQVIARGDGRFQAVGCRGGLPGAGWDRSAKLAFSGKTAGGRTVLAGEGDGAKGLSLAISDGRMEVADAQGAVIGRLERVVRKSPTLGAKPPAGAVVLFDGTSAESFRNANASPLEKAADGLLRVKPGSGGLFTKQPFKSCRLHLEFRLPFEPKGDGQGRANSGCYLQGRYEVQILDSFGLAGKENECGGIYSSGKDPLVNMCLPPLSWQTYDIDFTAATFDAQGKKTADAVLTVHHNGVLIYQDQKIGHTTTAAPHGKEIPEGQPHYLQDHGHEVCFRNVWLVER